MTVAVETVAVKFLNVATNVPVSCNFPAFAASDVHVYYGTESEEAIQNVDYTVILAADFSTFYVTPTASLLAKINELVSLNPLTESNFITVRREMELLTDATAAAVRNTPFTAREFDRTAMRFQQMQERLNRAIVLDDKFVGNTALITVQELVASRLLAVDASGLHIVAGPSGDDIENAQMYAEIALAAAAQAQGGVGSLIFDTLALATAYAPAVGPERICLSGYYATGDLGAIVPYKKVASEPTHGGKFSITLADTVTVVWYELSVKVCTPQMFGAKGDGITNDNAALVKALGYGKPIFLPPGTYLTSAPLGMPANTVIFGSWASVIESTTAGAFGLTSNGVSNIVVSGIALRGCATPSIVPASAGIQIANSTDFLIENCLFERWPDQGIRVIGAATAITERGSIRNNTLRDPVVPHRFDGSGIFIREYTREVELVGNHILGEWDCGWFMQDQAGNGISGFTKMRAIRNYVDGPTVYGGGIYSLALPIVSVVDNGSGEARLTVIGHKYTTGDRVNIQLYTALDGMWRCTVIDDDTLDLDTSTYTAGYPGGGFLRVGLEGDCIIAENYFYNIVGARTPDGIVFSFGSGLYLQTVGNCMVVNNHFRRTNQMTNGGSLTPAALGVNNAVGDTYVDGNIIEDCGWDGIRVVAAFLGNGKVFIGGGNLIRDCMQVGMRLSGTRDVVVGPMSIYPRRDEVLSTVLYADVVTGLTVCGLRARNCYNKQRPVRFTNCSSVIMADCRIRFEGDGTASSELVFFDTVDTAIIEGNLFDGDVSEFTALSLNATKNAVVESNVIRAKDSVAARALVTMTGDCTGTVFGRSNKLVQTGATHPRMNNGSTGGLMHTRDSDNSSGGKTRQIGDTIENTALTAAGVYLWGKIAASAGTADWKTISLSA